MVSAIALSLILVITTLAVIFVSSPLKRASKNLTAYAINAELTDERTIVGSETIDYINSTGTNLSSICLHLFARAFRQDATIKPYTALSKASCYPNGDSYGDIQIKRVDIAGNSANFIFSGQDQDILQINTNLASGKRTKIYIEFVLNLANCTHRMGYYNGIINLGNWYPIVSAYSGGWLNYPYYSTGDPFVSDCANYSVNITYPSEYSCYASGNLDKFQQNITKTSTYSALAARDFAVFLSNKAVSQTTKVNKTNITYVGYNGDQDIQTNAKVAALATSYFSKKFAEYPYSSLVVCKSSFLQGGMEYSGLVLVSDAITDSQEFAKVIVHEIAHQWWYNLVGNNQVTEAWLDESLAEYSTCLFFEDNNIGESYKELIKDATASYLIYVDVIDSLNGKINLAMNSSVSDYTSEYEYTYMVYVKGVIMFDTLRDAVGKDKLIRALKKYCKKYSYKIATGQDLIEVLKSVCHKDLDGFFKGWLNGTNVVTTTFVSLI